MAPAYRALTCFALVVLMLRADVAPAAEQRALQLDAALRQELFLPASGPLELMTLFTGKDPRYSDAELRQNAPWIVRFEAAHVGGSRLLFKATFGRRPVFASDGLILYADLDCNPDTGRADSREHRGVDLMVSVSRSSISMQYFAPVASKANTTLAAVRQVGNAVYITLDAPLTIEKGKVRIRAYLASERPGGRSSGTPREPVELPYAADRQVPPLGHGGTPDLRPLSDYRYHNDLVKLEKLADKGMTYAMVRPARPLEFGRTRPLLPFAAAGRKPGRAGSLQRQRVPVDLLEERGVGRRGAVVSFGLPLPQGGLFDLGQIRILAPAGAEVPAQLTVTSFWPDDSLKWVLVEFAAPLPAQAHATYTVELGNQVRQSPWASPLKLDEAGDVLTVVTGPLKVAINKRKFHLLDGVWLEPDGQPVVASPPEGARLVDEHGTLFSMAGRPPESVRIEEHGPRKIVVRVEGVYTSAQGEPYMRYIARLVFRAGSPRVDLIYTHVNDYLQTEFTDVTSLDLPFIPAATAGKTAIALADDDTRLTAHTGDRLALFQVDEHRSTLRVDGRDVPGGRAPGVLRTAVAGPASAHSASPGFTAVVHDFWQRWPKGLAADEGRVQIELLPKQPGPDFGRGLPHQLLFPFVEGFYRFKWGMSFTERVSFDFSGRMAPEELLAEADDAIVPVLPAAWYARTEALGRLAVPLGRQFALWDKHAADSYRDFLRARDSDRCYGYFNYGDWYGERGRNWGNNEYDFAHGYFMQFARTGNRDYFRVSLAAARHQADVDCVHAYPDPYYVGGNHEHSIGHTGMWTDQPRYGTWTWRYGGDTSADNGHTWSEGMVEAWFLTGDAPVMETALGLGEHIVWAMSRNFKRLGTHERSAGWSLKAIIGLYRATYDPLYLDAARRIAAVALAEQKFADGGAWPHLLPGDHSGGRAAARGNAIFLIGILMQGLAEYHQETHDPAVPRSLAAGADWLLRCWNEEAQGWPYTALVSGEPLFKPGLGANLMVAGPIAYAGQVNNQPRFINTAEAALAAVVHSGSSGSGKAIAQQMNFTSNLLAILQQWYATHRSDKGADVLSGAGDDMARYLAKTADAKEHSVRGPNQKIFLVRLRGGDGQPVTATLTAAREPFGAMGKRAATGSIQVLNSAGAVVKQGAFSTDLSHAFQCPLAGPAGTVFKVLIDDDQRGVWSLAGQRLQILMQTVPRFCIGDIGRGRYHFFVPQGTDEFHVHLRPGHNGLFAGVVLTPHEKIAGFFAGLRQSAAPARSKAKPAAAGVKPTAAASGTNAAGGGSNPDSDLIAEQGLITVRPDSADTGQIWSLVLTAGGDLEIELQGVPPYLALTADAWPPAAHTAAGK